MTAFWMIRFWRWAFFGLLGLGLLESQISPIDIDYLAEVVVLVGDESESWWFWWWVGSFWL